MKKAEICRAISEKLEPLDSFEWVGISDCLMCHSPKWYWTKLGGDPAVAFRPFDIEDASARLLEAMPWPTLKHCSRRDNQWWNCDADIPGNYSQGISADRKTAIVLAACKWLKIEVGEIED